MCVPKSNNMLLIFFSPFLITNDLNRLLASMFNEKSFCAQEQSCVLNLVTSYDDSYCSFEMAN